MAGGALVLFGLATSLVPPSGLHSCIRHPLMLPTHPRAPTVVAVLAQPLRPPRAYPLLWDFLASARARTRMVTRTLAHHLVLMVTTPLSAPVEWTTPPLELSTPERGGCAVRGGSRSRKQRIDLQPVEPDVWLSQFERTRDLSLATRSGADAATAADVTPAETMLATDAVAAPAAEPLDTTTEFTAEPDVDVAMAEVATGPAPVSEVYANQEGSIKLQPVSADVWMSQFERTRSLSLATRHGIEAAEAEDSSTATRRAPGAHQPAAARRSHAPVASVAPRAPAAHRSPASARSQSPIFVSEPPSPPPSPYSSHPLFQYQPQGNQGTAARRPPARATSMAQHRSRAQEEGLAAKARADRQTLEVEMFLNKYLSHQEKARAAKEARRA